MMRATVEVPADGIWEIQGADALSDAQWLLAEQDATNLVAASTLISIPGTGKNDEQWTASTDWQGWTANTQKVALDIRNAVKTKNLTALSEAADRLTAACQSCHDKYRPQTPTDGVLRYPFYPKRKLHNAAK
jgi:hypothetical protein